MTGLIGVVIRHTCNEIVWSHWVPEIAKVLIVRLPEDVVVIDGPVKEKEAIAGLKSVPLLFGDWMVKGRVCDLDLLAWPQWSGTRAIGLFTLWRSMITIGRIIRESTTEDSFFQLVRNLDSGSFPKILQPFSTGRGISDFYFRKVGRCQRVNSGHPSSFVRLKVMPQVVPLDDRDNGISDSSSYSDPFKNAPSRYKSPPWFGIVGLLAGFGILEFGWIRLRGTHIHGKDILAFLGGVIAFGYGCTVVLLWIAR